ncbi:MAG: hypothetical protein ACLP9L_28805 [Thermoguttaceae bacterium]
MSEESAPKPSERSQADLMELHRQLQETASKINWSDPSSQDCLRTLEEPTMVSEESRGSSIWVMSP